jgi:cardiolipin synthase
MLKLHLLAVFSFLFSLILISHLLKERRAPGSTAAWLLLIILVPYVGVPLYLFFGGRKIRKITGSKHGFYRSVPYEQTPEDTLPVERILLAAGVRGKSDSNEIEILKNGQISYQTLFELIQGAKKSVHITTFILKLDEVGRSIVQLLEEKSKSGVEVKLLLDGLGSFWTFRWRLSGLRKAGGKVSVFLPLFHLPFLGHSNLRNHRKLVIVDGSDAMIGGMNLASEYLGPVERSSRWVDLLLRVRGPVVKDLHEVFSEDWEFASGKKIVGSLSGGAHGGNETLQAVASGPDVKGDALYDSIATAIFNASSRIWIATPYFIPDETLSKALELAAKRGVDVRILLPKKSNHFLADICRGSYVRQLEQAGAKICFYLPTMLHAKAVLIDQSYAIVGSANLDMRSLLLNFEVGLVIYSATGIQMVSAWFETVLKETELGKASEPSFLKQIEEGFGRILGQVL